MQGGLGSAETNFPTKGLAGRVQGKNKEREQKGQRETEERERKSEGVCVVVDHEKDQKSLVPKEGLLAIIQGSNKWLPRLAHGENFLLVYSMEFNLYRFPYDAFHTSDFLIRIKVKVSPCFF
jgi:hypothetical protein